MTEEHWSVSLPSRVGRGDRLWISIPRACVVDVPPGWTEDHEMSDSETLVLVKIADGSEAATTVFL